MKIELELSDSFFLTKRQLQRITEEICKNITDERVMSFLVPYSESKLKIEDNKTHSLKDGTFYRKRTTKSGIIKIKVWN